MDAPFAEYVAVVRAMRVFNGERPDDLPSEFHDESELSEPATLDHEHLGV